MRGSNDGSDERFAPDLLTGLPEPARRYLSHAIRPGTPLAHAATVRMTGSIRLAPRLPWLAMVAEQVLAPPEGFVWEARIGRFGLVFVGADTYLHGRGETAFRLWGRIPVVRAGGADVSRAARGRLAIESIWHPASLLPQRGVTWTELDDETARATLAIDGEAIPVTLTVGPSGALRSVRIDRWGNLTTDGRYAPIPFGADVFEERTFGGYTVPSRLRVSWWHGTAREFPFFTARLDAATFHPGPSEAI